MDDVHGRWPATAALPCMLVDLDRTAQGARFDIVVLGEGIAAGADHVRRLLNARSLLLDDGRLVVLEQQSSRAADLLHGLDPAWWRCRPAHAECSRGAPAILTSGGVARAARARELRNGRGRARPAGRTERRLPIDRTGRRTAAHRGRPGRRQANLAHLGRRERLFRGSRDGADQRARGPRSTRRDARDGLVVSAVGAAALCARSARAAHWDQLLGDLSGSALRRRVGFSWRDSISPPRPRR